MSDHCARCAPKPSLTADEILAWRRGMGLTEPAAAKLIGHPPSSYRQWEDGKNKPPGAVVMLIRYIQHFGVLPHA